MNILMVHNKYQEAGGEDVVFEMERDLMSDHGHNVETLVFDNHDLTDWFSKLSMGAGLLYNFRSARLLGEKIRTFCPNIIHVHNFFPLASPSILFKAKECGIPIVMTLHNFRLICPSGSFIYLGKIYDRSLHSHVPIDAIVKGVYRNSRAGTAAVVLMTSLHNLFGTWKNKVDRFILLSRFARNKFRESKVAIRDEQFVVKPNFASDYGETPSSREDFYLYVGRLLPEKGILVLLEAAASAGYKLTVAGDGPSRDAVQAYSTKHANIRWLGYQRKTDVIALLKRCKALVVPSVCYEGFGLAAIEAFSTGTPVVASRLGSLVEIVTDGVNGFLFDSGRPDDLNQKLHHLNALSQQQYDALCHNARQTYLSHYTPEKNYEMLIAIYNGVVANASFYHSKLLKTMKGVEKRFDATFIKPTSKRPLVSIGIPTFNGGKRISKSLQSILDQHYSNLEIIISDNSSEDNTKPVCEELASKHPEIKYYRQEVNLGLVGNFEFVLSKATGEYFMWVSDDDALEPATILKYVSFLENNNQHVLVSGAIQYWQGAHPANVERGFTLEQRSPIKRCIAYYSSVVYGGMFHGMMRTGVAQLIPSRKVFGNDYHFVASLAFEGMVKNFDSIGYNKWLGGTSRDNIKYARAIGESKFTGYFPHLKMSFDAFAEVLYRSTVFKKLPLYDRFFTGIASAFGILYCYGVKILPFTIGGICKRSIQRSGSTIVDATSKLAGLFKKTRTSKNNNLT